VILFLQIIGGLFTLAGKLFDYLNQKQMVDLAKTSQQLENLKAQVDAAHKSVEIREAVRAALERDKSSVLSVDEFTRPDD
jgi:phage-related minor tail protein